MIYHLKGILADKGELPGAGAYFVVDVGGLGYLVHTSTRALLQAPALQMPVMVYTSLMVREDAMDLVGFLTVEERDIFDILRTASGVGFKVALALMSQLQVPELASAIVSGDARYLTAAKGVGPKLAQKICLELKEKVSQWCDNRLSRYPASLPGEGAAQATPKTPAFQEAEAVLLSLGYSLPEIYEGFRAMQHYQEGDVLEAMSSEEILQQVLKWLATQTTLS